MGAAGAKTLVGAGEQSRLLKIVAAAASLKLLLCVILIPPLGAVGAAVAVAVSWSLAMICEAYTAAVCFPSEAAGVDRGAAAAVEAD
jgi:O-antigen/teichoic acid export membrane protein